MVTSSANPMNDLNLKSNLFYSVIIFIAMTLGCKEQECSSYCFESIKQSKTCYLTLCDTSEIESIESYSERYNYKQIDIVQKNPRRIHSLQFGDYYPFSELSIFPKNRPKNAIAIYDEYLKLKSTWVSNLGIKSVSRQVINSHDLVTIETVDRPGGPLFESYFISDSMCFYLSTFYFPGVVDTIIRVSDRYHYDLLRSIEFKNGIE